LPHRSLSCPTHLWKVRNQDKKILNPEFTSYDILEITGIIRETQYAGFLYFFKKKSKKIEKK